MYNQDTWIQGSMAQDAEGEPCAIDDPNAVRFCLLGMLMHRYGSRTQACMRAIHDAKQIVGGSLVLWNDIRGRKWEDVKYVLDRIGFFKEFELVEKSGIFHCGNCRAEWNLGKELFREHRV